MIVIPALGLGLGLTLTACSSGTSSADGAASSAAATRSASAPAAIAQPTTSPVATSVPAVTAAPTTAGRSADPSATLVPMQTSTGGEFFSPSGNISCEIDYHRAGLTQVYCQTGTPARSVTMGITGTYTACTGQQCLGNAGEDTPTLAYGTATGVGPFRCESSTGGVTCLADGRGFRISTAGITPASA